MTDETAVNSKFAGGEFNFWLPLSRVVALERITSMPLMEIEDRLRASLGTDENGEFVYLGGGGVPTNTILEVIRQGLQGGTGGTMPGDQQISDIGPNEAATLVSENCYPERPLHEAVVLAGAIVFGAVHGVHLKKKAQESDPEAKSSTKAS